MSYREVQKPYQNFKTISNIFTIRNSNVISNGTISKYHFSQISMQFQMVFWMATIWKLQNFVKNCKISNSISNGFMSQTSQKAL